MCENPASCRLCGSRLSAIVDDDIEPREGNPGEVRCRDLTCPYADIPQREKVTTP